MKIHPKHSLYTRLISGLFVMFSITTTQAMNLSSTVEDAIMHNPEFREQIKLYQGIESDLKGAEGSWYPKIDLTTGMGIENIDRAGTSKTSLTRTEASARLTQNLFEGYGTVNEISRQEARLDSSAHSAQAKANQIALDMVTAYLNLLKEQELKQLAIESKSTHERILDQITQRSQAGIGNQVEVDQAKGRLALSNSNLMAAYNNYNDALARFQRVLGRMPDHSLVKPNLEIIFPETMDEAINIALISHPTLRSANADIAQSRAQHKAASGSFYPRVDFELEQSFDNNTNGIEGKNNNLQAMFRMRYNLYNGGKDTANRNRTATGVQQAAEIRNNSRRQIIENLSYAWAAKTYIAEQLEYIHQHIQLTHETLIGYRKQFTLGRRSLLDLLNTEDEYISALISLVESEADYTIAEYRILNAMGKLNDALGVNIKYATVKNDYSNE
ncbi:MAG: outer membrane protein, adhesin transport system [Thiomicrorhabdus sp.]|nr:MAG: outer membrane protein, adhesin transport system [Thiomicrorhabdus sp.]